jgi:hypothetical protein
MEEIKGKVPVKQSHDTIRERRNLFISKSKTWDFDRVTCKVFNSRQRSYIGRIFKVNKEGPH